MLKSRVLLALLALIALGAPALPAAHAATTKIAVIYDIGGRGDGGILPEDLGRGSAVA